MFFNDLLRHGVAVFALALAAPFAWGADLFVPVDAAEAVRFPPPSVASATLGEAESRAASENRWLVRVDQQRLFRTIHAVERRGADGSAAAERLVLNVAEGFAMEVAAERTQRTLSGHSLSGRVVGTPGSAVTLTMNGEVVVGTVWTPGAIYEIAPLRNGVHVFRTVDRSAALPLGEPIRPKGGEYKSQRTKQGNAAGGSVVDVLVVWTPKARQNVESIGQGERICASASSRWWSGPTKPTCAAVRRCD